jgi:hypothetical protein
MIEANLASTAKSDGVVPPALSEHRSVQVKETGQCQR